MEVTRAGGKWGTNKQEIPPRRSQTWKFLNSPLGILIISTLIVGSLSGLIVGAQERARSDRQFEEQYNELLVEYLTRTAALNDMYYAVNVREVLREKIIKYYYRGNTSFRPANNSVNDRIEKAFVEGSFCKSPYESFITSDREFQAAFDKGIKLRKATNAYNLALMYLKGHGENRIDMESGIKQMAIATGQAPYKPTKKKFEDESLLSIMFEFDALVGDNASVAKLPSDFDEDDRGGVKFARPDKNSDPASAGAFSIASNKTDCAFVSGFQALKMYGEIRASNYQCISGSDCVPVPRRGKISNKNVIFRVLQSVGLI